MARADKKTGWVGKKLIVHLPISVTKSVMQISKYHFTGEISKLVRDINTLEGISYAYQD